MTRRLVWTATLVVALAACGGDPGSQVSSTTTAATPNVVVDGTGDGIGVDSIGTCEELADASIVSTQNLIDEVDSMSIEEQNALLGNSNSEVLAAYGLVRASLEGRATVLGCANTEMERLVLQRVGSLSSTSDVGQLLVDSMSGLAETEVDAAVLEGFSFTQVALADLVTCDQVADTGVRWTEDLLDFVDGLTVAQQQAMSGREQPAVFAELGTLTATLSGRASELGCDDETIRRLSAERMGGLTAESAYGRVLLGFFVDAARPSGS